MQKLISCVVFFSDQPSYITVQLGQHRRNGKTEWQITSNIDKIIIHPAYSASTFKNDIALLRLSVSIILTLIKYIFNSIVLLFLRTQFNIMIITFYQDVFMMEVKHSMLTLIRHGW